MPIYLYECSACEKTFELEQKIVEDAIKDCPCGSKGTVKRLIQPIAVMFKGSGFYVNDSTPNKSESPRATLTEDGCTGEPSTCACATPPITSDPS